MTAATTNGSTSASQTLLDNVTPITVVRSYDHLRHAIADWCDHIHMTRAELDAEAGLADGHAAKLPTETILPAFSSGAALRSATAAKRSAAR